MADPTVHSEAPTNWKKALARHKARIVTTLFAQDA
jgi:hypothetical protein